MSITAELEQNEQTHLGVSKIDRYKWTIKDSRGEYMAIDKNDLFVDHAYQRDQNDNKTIEMARSWSWMACGAILVAMRKDGTHFVFDGQHRVMAARKRSDISNLDCLVFEVDEITDEASGFLKSNTLRKPVSMAAKFKAMLVCNDENAIGVSNMLEELGLKTDKNCKPGHFGSLAWAVKSHARNRESFCKTMRIVASLAGSKYPIHESMCRGVLHLHAKHGALDCVKFVRRMHQVGYQELFDALNRAASYYKRGGEKQWGQGILDAVNHGLRNRFYVEQPSDCDVS